MHSLATPPEAETHMLTCVTGASAAGETRRAARVLQIFAAVSTPPSRDHWHDVLAVPEIEPSSSGRSRAHRDLLALEAIARGRLLAYASTVAIAVVVSAIILTVVLGLIAEWRLTIAALLFAAAGIVLIFNLSELRRS